MIKLMDRFRQTFFNSALDLRVRLFHVLAMAGATLSFTMAVSVAVSSGSVAVALLDLAGAVIAAGILYYSSRTGRYQQCYMITIVAIFLILLPVVFFTGNGYNGSMPSFFIFAIVFTAFMLEGKKAFAMAALEIAVYSGICFIAYLYPNSVSSFDNETTRLVNIVSGIVVVGVALGITMLLQFRLYNAQQKKLDEQNEILAQANRTKTEFLANTSH